VKQIQAYVREEVGAVLGLDPGFAIDPQQGLRDLGIDSLMSIEMRNRLQDGVGQPLPSTLVFDFPTIAALGEYLGTLALGPEMATEPSVAGPEEDRVRAAAELEGLSDEEAEALLLEELSRGHRGQAV
jgi:acyl carrier protein